MTTAGFLNKREISFLVQYAINQLMAQGVLFHIKEQQLAEGDDESFRITLPDGMTMQ